MFIIGGEKSRGTVHTELCKGSHYPHIASGFVKPECSRMLRAVVAVCVTLCGADSSLKSSGRLNAM